MQVTNDNHFYYGGRYRTLSLAKVGTGTRLVCTKRHLDALDILIVRLKLANDVYFKTRLIFQSLQ